MMKCFEGNFKHSIKYFNNDDKEIRKYYNGGQIGKHIYYYSS